MAIFSKTLTKGKRELWQVADAVLKLNTTDLGANALASFVEFVPQSDEVEAARAFLEQGGSVNKLAPAEKFICSMIKIPRLTARVANMLFKVQFDDSADDLENRIDTIVHNCDHVSNSRRFGRILSIILKVGNELNRGTYKGNSQGFKIKSLTKLTQTKTNKGSTLLEYLVLHLKRSKDSDILNLGEDFPEIEAASRINLDTMNADLAKLRGGIRNMTNTLKVAKQDDGQYVEAVTPFLDRAGMVFDAMEAKHAKMRSSFEKLCKYLGENPARTKPEDLFGTLHTFVRSLNATVRKVEETIARKERMRKREEEKKARLEKIKKKSSA